MVIVFKVCFFCLLTILNCNNNSQKKLELIKKQNQKSGNKIIEKKPKDCKKFCQYGSNFWESLKDFFSLGTKVPNDITPVTHFDINKYIGKWYEVARLDHSFEKNLTEVTATYELNQDKTINVINRGVNPRSKERIIKGIAKPAQKDPTVGHLKVSFWKPFYGSYVIFYLETQNENDEYSLALVCGSTKKFCWILSRKPKISKQKIDEMLKILKEKGFKIENLIYLWGNNKK